MSQERNEIAESLMRCITLAVKVLNPTNNADDAAVVLGLLNCYKIELKKSQRKKRTKWTKLWREQSHSKGSYTSLTKELHVEDYQNYMRMSPKKFDILLSFIEKDVKRQNTIMREAISPADKLSATLRFLVTGESYVSISKQSKLSAAFLSHAVPEVCNAVWKNLKPKYFKFPTEMKEWEEISSDFAINCQFPNCLGALDGKHINFRAKREDGEYYRNYKGTDSIVLLALVDSNCRFIYVDVGCNGRTNDADVFGQSSLKNVLLNANNELPPEKIIGSNRSLPYVVVADDAFPMQQHLLKPYPYDTKCIDQKIFNYRISRARQVVEQAFDILANRFMVLQSTINLRAETVEIITLACCTLHNFLMADDNYYQSGFGDVTTFSDDANVATQAVDNPLTGAAETVRQKFMAYFNDEGRVECQDEKM